MIQAFFVFIALPLLGIALGSHFGAARVLSGKVALFFTGLAPAGAGLAPVFC